MTKVKPDHETKYLRFYELPSSGKTKQWEVVSHRQILLGVVKWWGAWRQYVFFPDSHTLYNPTCLNEIAEFCQTKTKGHRAKK